MYQVGEQVIYGSHGVCEIITREERLIDRKKVLYLVLEPVGQTGSRYYVPEHNTAAMAKMHPMMTRLELDNLIKSETVHADAWIPDENRRKQVYRELIVSGDRVKLMQMVRSLYLKRKNSAESGKKLHLCDENFLRDAEKVLIGEISLVLDLDLELTKKYLHNQLDT